VATPQIAGGPITSYSQAATSIAYARHGKVHSFCEGETADH